MKKTDELFTLIKSLSKTEKRYFKLYSSKNSSGEKNNYQRLFEFIEKQSEYDEEKIKNEFRGEKFTENFFAIKSYLFDVILNSLVEYNRERIVNFKLYDDIMKASILVSKGLKKSALKLSEKAVKIAKVHNKYSILEDLYDLQIEKILISDIIHYQKRIEKIDSERLETLDELNSYIKTSVLYDKVASVFIVTPLAASPSQIKRLDWILDEPLFKDDSKVKGFYAKLNLFALKRRYFWYIGDYDRSLYYRKTELTLHDEFPEIKKEIPIKYFMTINNYLIHSWFSISYAECEEYFLKLKSHGNKIIQTVKDEFIIKLVFFTLFVAEVMWYERNNEPEKILKKIETLEEQLKKFNTKMETVKLLDIYSLAGSSLFRLGHFKDSLALTNKVLNNKESVLLENLYNFNLVKAIVIHYELGNYDLVDSLKSKLERINKKNYRMLPSEKDLVKGILKLVNAISPKESLSVFEELKYNFEKKSGMIMDKLFIIRMGLINWLNRHIEAMSNEQ